MNTHSRNLRNLPEYRINCILDDVTRDIYADITRVILYNENPIPFLSDIYDILENMAQTVVESRYISTKQKARITRRIYKLYSQALETFQCDIDV